MMKALGKAILSLFHRKLSYREISGRTGASKSLVHYWVKKYGRLNSEDRKKLEAWRKKKREVARKKGLLSIKRIRHQARQNAIAQAHKEFGMFLKEPLFLIGLGLYMGEGRKEVNVTMANLDLGLLRLFVKWSRRYLGITEFAGSLTTAVRKRYGNFCKEIGRAIGVKLRWAKNPLRPLSRRKYNREYGVVSIRGTKASYASLKIHTWINDALRLYTH